MLGFGHTPAAVLAAMAKPQAMANIMTPNLSQLRFAQAMRKEIGQTRGGCPYTRFLCLNSGSESVSLASPHRRHQRQADDRSGARHAGDAIKRWWSRAPSTAAPNARRCIRIPAARPICSTWPAIATRTRVLTVPNPTTVDAPAQVFADADANGWFIEAMFLEPVMGEGDPGRSVPPAFYAAARELTRRTAAMLLVDSIQAGLRAMAYCRSSTTPASRNVDPPDMETYSKALNAASTRCRCWPSNAPRRSTARACTATP
jgi:acetylornithine/succinyldiaminopimelate/putrescine aminotransferase